MASTEKFGIRLDVLDANDVLGPERRYDREIVKRPMKESLLDDTTQRPEREAPEMSGASAGAIQVCRRRTINEL